MTTVVSPLTQEILDQMIMTENVDRAFHQLSEDDLAPLVRYVEQRILPGKFLRYVLMNDLAEAAARADVYNRRRLYEYVTWLYNDAPSGCWGSAETVSQWVAERKTE